MRVRPAAVPLLLPLRCRCIVAALLRLLLTLLSCCCVALLTAVVTATITEPQPLPPSPAERMRLPLCCAAFPNFDGYRGSFVLHRSRAALATSSIRHVVSVLRLQLLKRTHTWTGSCLARTCCSRLSSLLLPTKAMQPFGCHLGTFKRHLSSARAAAPNCARPLCTRSRPPFTPASRRPKRSQAARGLWGQGSSSRAFVPPTVTPTARSRFLHRVLGRTAGARWVGSAVVAPTPLPRRAPRRAPRQALGLLPAPHLCTLPCPSPCTAARSPGDVPASRTRRSQSARPSSAFCESLHRALCHARPHGVPCVPAAQARVLTFPCGTLIHCAAEPAAATTTRLRARCLGGRHHRLLHRLLHRRNHRRHRHFRHRRLRRHRASRPRRRSAHRRRCRCPAIAAVAAQLPPPPSPPLSPPPPVASAITASAVVSAVVISSVASTLSLRVA